MAFRAATKQWRSMLINSVEQNGSFSSRSTTSTTTAARTRKYATTATANMRAHEPHLATMPNFPMADLAPVMIMGGFIVFALTIATHSAWQQLAYGPSVQVQKKKRKTVPEVYTPDAVLGSSDKFINKFFLRKVAQIQDNMPTLVNHSRPNPITRSGEIETLKSSVGVGK